MFQVGIRNFASDNSLTFFNCTKLSGGFRTDLLQRVDFNIAEPTTSFIGFFANCTSIKTDFNCELPTTIQDISCICSGCTNLTGVTSSFLPTTYDSKTVNVSGIFAFCSSLSDFPPSANNLWQLPSTEVVFISISAFTNCPVSGIIPLSVVNKWI